MSDTRCYRGHVITDPLEGICPHCEDGTVTLYPARQARTIRRLFTAYFLAKAKLKRPIGEGVFLAKIRHHAREEERARIVAALGASVWTGSLYPPEVHAAVQAIRDTIERGEL